jgi:hypothetical protein
MGQIMRIEKTEDILDLVKKLPSEYYGLRWRPTLEPDISDNVDYLDPVIQGRVHFSTLDSEALEYAFNLVNEPKVIVEIGVDAVHQYDISTSTGLLLNLKPKDCIYIGIDVNDKSHLNNSEHNIYTLQNDSANHQALYNQMTLLGVNRIDLLFVDGWHSINQVLAEWLYWEKMTPNGVMAFHDTNYHPGPVAVLDAIDTNLFSVEYFGRGQADWGVGVVQRR